MCLNKIKIFTESNGHLRSGDSSRRLKAIEFLRWRRSPLPWPSLFLFRLLILLQPQLVVRPMMMTLRLLFISPSTHARSYSMHRTRLHPTTVRWLQLLTLFPPNLASHRCLLHKKPSSSSLGNQVGSLISSTRRARIHSPLLLPP